VNNRKKTTEYNRRNRKGKWVPSEHQVSTKWASKSSHLTRLKNAEETPQQHFATTPYVRLWTRTSSHLVLLKE
jgi:hypothetical protein